MSLFIVVPLIKVEASIVVIYLGRRYPISDVVYPRTHEKLQVSYIVDILLKFMFSKKATEIDEISSLYLKVYHIMSNLRKRLRQ